jgi:hypothetical protein
MGWEYVEDARSTDRLPDFRIQLRIQSVVEELPLASVRCIAEARRTPKSTVFYILTELLALRFHHWQWVPHLVSDGQKADKAQQAALMIVEQRRWANFLTDDESWIMWIRPPTGSGMTMDEE